MMTDTSCGAITLKVRLPAHGAADGSAAHRPESRAASPRGLVDSFEAPRAERFRYLARPTVLAVIFLAIARLGEGGLSLPAGVFFAIVAMVLVQDFRLAVSIADRVITDGDQITYRVAFGTRSVPMSSLLKVQALNRGSGEDPRRVARVVLGSGEFWFSERMSDFDRLITHLLVLAPKASTAEMTIWERIWWLQWGASASLRP